MTCELTWDGYLHLSTSLAEGFFPAGVCVAVEESGTLVLMPLRSEANGGLLLKRRNAAGDRSLLVSEVLGHRSHAGTFQATWDAGRGALIVALDQGVRGGTDGADGGHPGTRAMGGVPAGDRRGGDRSPTPVGAPIRTGSPGGGIGRPAGSPPPAPPGPGRADMEVVN